MKLYKDRQAREIHFYIIELDTDSYGYYFNLNEGDYNYTCYYKKRYEHACDRLFDSGKNRYELLIEGNKKDIETRIKQLKIIEELEK